VKAEPLDTHTTKLVERGLRTTRARVLILAALAGRNDHPTADVLLRALREAGDELGPATLYQNLGKLSDAGLIQRLTGPDGLMHFDATVTSHPHLSCVECGCIVDVKVDESLFANLKPVCAHTNRPLSRWRLEAVNLELKGLCPTCQSARQVQSKNTQSIPS
jgi:Fur family transcriptional regulator, peroxide stress response regulator